jgi:hypothetical protein
MNRYILEGIGIAIMLGGNIAMWVTTGNTTHWFISCAIYLFGVGIIIGTLAQR